jgi:hypothetical protein
LKTRFIHFAGSTVAILYEGNAAADLLDFLFRHVQFGEEMTTPHLTFRLVCHQSTNVWQLSQGNTWQRQSKSGGEIARQLVEQVCYHLTDRCTGGLVLHAAGLAWHGQGIIFPGQTGTGKSSLAAWLLRREFSYLTDELVFVPWQSNMFEAFPRPLNLKAAARPTLYKQLGLIEQDASILSSQGVDLVQPSYLSKNDVLHQSSLACIIFPHYQPEAAFGLRPFSKAETGLHLMQCLVNARNLPEHGFTEVTRLAHNIPAFQLIYNDFDQLGGKIEGLLS